MASTYIRHSVDKTLKKFNLEEENKKFNVVPVKNPKINIDKN